MATCRSQLFVCIMPLDQPQKSMAFHRPPTRDPNLEKLATSSKGCSAEIPLPFHEVTLLHPDANAPSLKQLSHGARRAVEPRVLFEVFRFLFSGPHFRIPDALFS